jgi:hypothetical protein
MKNLPITDYTRDGGSSMSSASAAKSRPARGCLWSGTPTPRLTNMNRSTPARAWSCVPHVAHPHEQPSDNVASDGCVDVSSIACDNGEAHARSLGSFKPTVPASNMGATGTTLTGENL